MSLPSARRRRGRHRHRPSPSVPLAYASLPPTPISRSPSPSFATRKHAPVAAPPPPPFSLWDYLREELLATDFDSHQELKWERVSNFLSMPLAMEKIIGFGYILCFDSFLYTFTILPIRCTLALVRLISKFLRLSLVPPRLSKSRHHPHASLVTTIIILHPLTDASKIYHTIRGQDTIKLYVIFNALEIADRLCASIGQDILDCLFSRSTLECLSRKQPLTSHFLRPFLFFLLAVLYNAAHTLVMVYQLLSLNVAVNSYEHALLTLLMSNQFVEIKGSVFKKFEKDNLFQITCADIVERFTLSLMLLIIAFLLPKSFGWFKGSGNRLFWTIFYPVVTVLASEAVVDWLKHAFITKFNHIRPSVYERYMDVLCRDLATASAVGRHGGRKHNYVDQSPLVARRLGFASLPLAVLAIIVGAQSIRLLFALDSDVPITSYFLSVDLVRYMQWGAMSILFWLCFVLVKIMLGVNLVSYATRRSADMEARRKEDVINDFGRDPIGEGKEERAYNRDLRTLLVDQHDDVAPMAEIGERRPGPKRRPEIEELTRWTMVKRIW